MIIFTWKKKIKKNIKMITFPKRKKMNTQLRNIILNGLSEEIIREIENSKIISMRMKM